MQDRSDSGTRYGVFVRFRKSRLPLRRGIASLEDAIVAAEALRRERLHGKDAVFIVREPDGAVIELSAAPAAPPKAEDAPAKAADEAPAAAGAAPEVADAAPPAAPPATRPSRPPASLPVEASLPARLELARRAIARAAEARARFDRSARALDAALQRADAPPALIEHHERTVALRALWLRALTSFEAATAVVESYAREAAPGAPLAGTRV